MNNLRTLLSILLVAGYVFVLGGQVQAQSLQENLEPVSDAGPDQTVGTNSTVILDGSTSTDPDENLPLTYQWTQTSGTLVTLSDSTAVNPTFTAPNAPETLTFSLMVTDSLGMAALAPDTVTITVDYNHVYLPIIMTPFPPAAFNKSSPVNNAVDQSVTPTLSWGTTSPLSHYEYCYDTTNDNDCSNWINNGTSTSVTLPALTPYTTYYWQVRAWNGLAGPTYANDSATSFWSLKTIPAPGIFHKISPSVGSINQSLTPWLSWGMTVPATNYEYCYDTTNDNACSTWISTGLNQSVKLPTLLYNTTYYWQVRAWNGGAGPTYANGSETAYWSFKTVQLPAPFNKIAPSNGATNQSMTPTLSWEATSPATYYEYCYDSTNDGVCTTWISSGLLTSVTLPVLFPGTTYYWQVRAWNGTVGPTYANGSDSVFWYFTTPAIPPWSLLLFENFEGTFPGNWYLNSQWYDGDYWYDVTGDISWGKNTCQIYAGFYSGRAVGGGSLGSTVSCYDGYPDNIETWMIIGPFDLTQAKDAYLTMKISLDTALYGDYLVFGASTDGESFHGLGYFGNSGGWQERVYDLKNVYNVGNLTGRPQVWVGIWFKSDSTYNGYEAGAWVDNISLAVCYSSMGCTGSPYVASTSLTSSNFREESVSISFPNRDIVPKSHRANPLDVPWFDLTDFIPDFK